MGIWRKVHVEDLYSAKMSGFCNEYCWLRMYAAIYWENPKEGAIGRSRRQNIIKMNVKTWCDNANNSVDPR
jgi:hypothetical protein